MSQQQFQGLATVAQRGEFDEIIDVRSPAEYAEDHIPGAINCAVLSDEERARVGTLYKQVSPFAARKVGAALVARNIADHIERSLMDRPREWRPLIYCWRGGQRSGAFTHVLRQIGWDAQRLEGGYKAWRRQVLADLNELPQRFSYCVICGPTGSAKSRILETLRGLGAQVLHLEDLAAHKGSVLGSLPDRPQPSQKNFETRLHEALGGYDGQRPIFVEAESRRIGQLQLPETLLQAIRGGRCFRVEAPLAARVDFLLADYAYARGDSAWLTQRLDRLRGLQSNELVDRWCRLAERCDWRELVSELLELHYDPHYHRSQTQNFSGHDEPGRVFRSDELSTGGIERLAREMLTAGGTETASGGSGERRSG